MMNRLTKLFQEKDKDLLSVYFTAGYPNLDSTGKVIRSLEANGIDMIEIGIPFSDPMADGVVIQQSGSKALQNGMTLPLLLEQVKEVRQDCQIPLVLMGYLNPVMQYGPEKLFRHCREIGVDAMIIPDLPFHEYMEHYKALCERYDIPVIMLITPETSEERIRLIDENCGGFIYMVSSASTTGVRDRFTDEQTAYFREIDGLKLRNRRLIGFGISNRATRSVASQYSNGVIVGSLFIKCLGECASVDEATSSLLEKLQN